jgi:hypothetical protein
MKFYMKNSGKLHEWCPKVVGFVVCSSRRLLLRRSLLFPCLAVLLYSCILVLGSFAIHPYYLSISEFNHKAAEKQIQVTEKFFADDLEEALEQELKQQVNILKKEDQKKNETLISQYLQKHLQLKVDGKPVALKMIGYEIELESVWVYLEANNVVKIKTAEVLNDILYSLRASQVNIIHFTNKGQRKSYRLSSPENKISFSW